MTKLIVSGGGTGGHIFPALQVALEARNLGWDVQYYGSQRGQERQNCENVMMPFTAFPSGPVYKPFNPAGVKSILQLLKATGMAMQVLRENRPDVIFATGGYAAAPILQAAKKLKIPTVLHEQNSIPGRTNRLAADHSRAICTVFHHTSKFFSGAKVHRTGMPIREAFRQNGQGSFLMGAEANHQDEMVLVMGGSQGSAAINDLALTTAVRMAKTQVQWFHITGRGHFENTLSGQEKFGVNQNYVIKSYLEADEMASAIFRSSVAICRSGAGTVSEMAAMRRPGIYIPYPHSFAGHQEANAREIAEIGGGDVLLESEAQAPDLEGRILSWMHDRDRVMAAQQSLSEWDVPDATGRILDILRAALV